MAIGPFIESEREPRGPGWVHAELDRSQRHVAGIRSVGMDLQLVTADPPCSSISVNSGLVQILE